MRATAWAPANGDAELHAPTAGLKNGIHFISGLPRSGSTLLAGLLRQNPRFHARMSSPVCGIYLSAQKAMSGRNEFSVFIDDAQRRRILRGVFENYYEDLHETKVIFDTNRAWCAKLSSLVQIFPDAKFICCVRSVPKIIESVERLVQRNAFQPSKIFNFETRGTIFSRAKALTDPGGMIRSAHDALLEAFHGEHAKKLLLIRYETLASTPRTAMEAIYAFLREPVFEHDYENVEYNADEFDERIGAPGLHRVARSVRYEDRPTILPPELVQKYEYCFWMDGARNRRNVCVV